MRTTTDLKEEIHLMSQILVGKERKTTINGLKRQLANKEQLQAQLKEETEKLISQNPELIRDPKFIIKRALLGDVSQVIKDAYIQIPALEIERLVAELLDEQKAQIAKRSLWFNIRKSIEYK